MTTKTFTIDIAEDIKQNKVEYTANNKVILTSKHCVVDEDNVFVVKLAVPLRYKSRVIQITLRD